MGFIWFVVAVTFFILWAKKNGAQSRDVQDSYNRGYYEGRQAFINLITSAFRKNSLSRDEFDKLVSPPAVSAAVESPEAELVEEPRGEPMFVETISEPVAPVRTKAEQANRNLNILLYTASFLIIAAAAAFIATSMPAAVRLSGLWLVIGAFYIVGLVLHAKVAYLQPAAIAFVGTGLALIPFAGIALSQLGGLSEGWSWFITSVIGLICYAIATIRLSSNIVGYLTIAFSLSLAASTVATVSGPAVLYFVALIVMSLIFHLLSHLKLAWVPDLFKRPIEHTGHLLTPLTLVGSLFAYDTMTIVSYQVVFWVATLYYVAIWATSRRYVFEVAIRLLLTISILISAFDSVKFDPTSCLWILLVVLAAQVLYSFVRVKPANPKSRMAEMVWYWVVIALLVNTIAYWFTLDAMREGVSTQVTIILFASLLMSWRIRSVPIAIPALFATVLLPFVIGRWPGEELLSMTVVTYLFAVMSVGALAISYFSKNRSASLRAFIQVAFWVYVTIGFFASIAQLSSGAFALSTVAFIAVSVAASYLYRQWQAELVSLVLLIPAVSAVFVAAGVKGEWTVVLTIGVVALIYLLAATIHELMKETVRRNLAVVSALVIGVGLLAGLFMHTDEAKVVSLALVLAYAIVGLTARLIVTTKFLQTALTLAYVTYPVLAFIIAFGLESGWFALVFGIATFIYAIATFAEKQTVYLTLANISLVGFVASLWNWLRLDPGWLFFATVWISAALIYVSYLLFFFKAKETNRSIVQLISFWVILGISVLLYIWFDGQYGYAAATSGVAIGASLVLHGLATKRRTLVESGIYVSTFAAQRAIGIAVPELTVLAYGHWWALTLGLVAYWQRGDKNTTLRFVLAVAALTIGSGIMALSSGGGYQLIFLVEHVILLVIGALSRTSWLLWWGLAATVLAVLYFLRSSLFLSLLFLGLTLISIVIWRLIRIQQKNKS